MVQKCDPIWVEDPSQLVQIRGDHVLLDVNERVEAEREVDRRVADHRQRPAVAHMEFGVFDVDEPPATRGDALRRQIHAGVPLAAPDEVSGPAAISRAQLTSIGGPT